MWSTKSLDDAPILYEPKKEYGYYLQKWQKIIKEKYDIMIEADYWDFHKFTVEHSTEFWTEVWDHMGIISSERFQKVLTMKGSDFQTCEWFPGAKINFAENLLRYRDTYAAMILEGEDREDETLTYAQMYDEVTEYAAAFRKLGLQKGDCVACYMSNRKEAVIAMLATVSIGAIWTGALPLLGPQAVLNRLTQTEPVFLITVDRFKNAGVEIEMLPKIKLIVDGLSSLKKVIIVPSKPESRLKDISAIRNSCFLEDFLEAGRNSDGSILPLQFEQVSFSHPIFINFTSGTTGLPKPIVHGTGILLQLGAGMIKMIPEQRGGVIHSVSPVGWASWTILNSLYAFGFTLLLSEGTPYFQSPTYFWDLVSKYKVSNLSFAASTLEEMQQRGYVPNKTHDLSSLRVISSLGSIVKPHIYDFVYEEVSKDAIFCAGYGSTELMGASLSFDPTVAVRRGEIATPSFGFKVEVVDGEGNPLVGEVGELVLAQPSPCLPLGIWKDKDGSIFREKYLNKYPGKFAMDDYAIINPKTKGYVICCRSDETLKQRGCRFGSSEIYNVVANFPDVFDSLCVSHYEANMDEHAVLFLQMRDGCSYSEELANKIREAIALELTHRHVPDIILETKDIPYNLNGKKMEILVKKIINKLPYNSDTLRNPDSLKYYFNIPELQNQ